MATTQQPSTKQDILHYLLKQGQATAHELATELDISPQAVRRHLKDMETEALICYSSVQIGMGRPQHVYQLSTKGRDRLQQNHGDNYSKFSISLLDTLAKTIGQEQLSDILHQQWQRKAEEYRERLGNGSLAQRVACLVELRKAEGFMAECHPVESNSARTFSFILTEHNCAISSLAESFPSVCGHELEMFAAILPDCQVERTHWIINGEHRCGYLVQAREQ